jgi:hypothetical protein
VSSFYHVCCIYNLYSASLIGIGTETKNFSSKDRGASAPADLWDDQPGSSSLISVKVVQTSE